jgi:hypothetical protein
MYKGELEMTKLKWVRRVPDSLNNFDLILTNPEELDSAQMQDLLDGIRKESHRKLTLNDRACEAFERWFKAPATPLRSDAYVLLSNWFMTNSGDRNSLVATQCERLWDALFACRPLTRLSSPEAGRNHIMKPVEFDSFWRRLQEAQIGNSRDGSQPSRDGATDPAQEVASSSEGVQRSVDQLHAKFEKAGVHCEMQGSPRSVAEFFKLLSSWEN